MDKSTREHRTKQNLYFYLSVANKAYIREKGMVKMHISKNHLLDNKQLQQELLGAGIMENTAPKKPILRGHAHQSMFFVSLGALIMLIAQTPNKWERISILVYAFGVISMFGISALYHRVNWSVDKKALFRRFDHSAIYIMIAGTMTPVAILGLSDQSMPVLLCTIWIVAILGIVKSFWFPNLPNILNVVLYLGAGIVVFPYLGELYNGIGVLPIILMAAGGIVYAIGAVVYGFKRPNPSPLYFGYHEIFHALVIVAAILHFIMIYLILVN